MPDRNQPPRQCTSAAGSGRRPPLPVGPAGRIAVTYYHYSPRCRPANCPISVQFTSSADGGATWSRPAQIVGPMQSSWLAKIGQRTHLSYFLTTTVLPGGHAVSAF